jgi:hypothetical protein
MVEVRGGVGTTGPSSKRQLRGDSQDKRGAVAMGIRSVVMVEGQVLTIKLSSRNQLKLGSV